MKKMLITLLMLTLALMLSLNEPVLANNYAFSSGEDYKEILGNPTTSDQPVMPDPMSENIRRNKDAAYFPPTYGVFSGEIPTDATSPYHSNLPTGGFIHQNQELPAVGNEDYAPGSSLVSAGFLPYTSQMATTNTVPWYYEDGSIGTLTIDKLNRTITVYEGENDENMLKGAGHFASTSAWDGNVALCGHNRGNNAHFSFVKDLETGDTLTYTTRYGTRTYRVYSISQTDELDSSVLTWSADNILTLVTCVANVPELRYVVTAIEIK